LHSLSELHPEALIPPFESPPLGSELRGHGPRHNPFGEGGRLASTTVKFEVIQKEHTTEDNLHALAAAQLSLPRP
jgi:hypothetical protein